MTRDQIDKRDEIIEIESVCEELASALYKFWDFNSSQEGYAMLLEELNELWDGVKANKGYGPKTKDEAIQVAAMGIKYAMLCSEKE